MSTPRAWDKWDEGCANDGARNHFVIPLVANHISSTGTSHVVDVGPGSGYLVHRLLDISSAAAACRWTLVDDDPDAVAFLKARFRNNHSVAVIRRRIPPLGDIVEGGPAIVLLSYTPLEMTRTELADTLKSVRRGDSVVVVMPDVLEDVSASESALDRFIAEGFVDLDKVDNTTGLPYPFRAHRFETIASCLTEDRLVIESIRTYTDDRRRRHFALIAAAP